MFFANGGLRQRCQFLVADFPTLFVTKSLKITVFRRNNTHLFQLAPEQNDCFVGIKVIFSPPIIT